MKDNCYFKRSFALLTTLMTAFTILLAFPSVKASGANAGDIIYYEGFESANTLQQNGDATFSLTNDYAAAGSSSLVVSPTADNNYSGVALRNDSLETPMLPGGKYRLTAKALSEKDTTLGVRVETVDSSGGNTYGSVGRFKAELKAGEWADIKMEFAVPSDHRSVTSIVFHNDDQIPKLTFYLDEVKLEILAFPEPVEEPEITELIKFTFDDKAENESLFTVASSSNIEWVEEDGIGHDDNTALKVTHIENMSYTSADNAVRLTLREPLPAGGVYQISAWFYAPLEGNENKDTLTGPGVVINAEYARSEYKYPSNFGTLPINEWKEVNVKTVLMEKELKSIDFRLVVNDEPKHADVWYLDNIVISRVGELKEVIVPEWDLTLPSLKDTYSDYFLIGNVMNPEQTTDEDTAAMYIHHYNAMTAENAMKPESMSKSKGNYSFTSADTLVEWAEKNKIKVIGHTLVWHSQSARWLTTDDDGNPLTRAEAKSNMEEYINQVAGHYKGKILAWDVVNEAFDGGSGIPKDWKSVLRKNSPWYLAYENGADSGKGESGADYIYDAFVFTRLADPGATLYYNDYNETEAWKREAIALMVEDLNEKWKTDERNTQPDRLLIEGIGMQSHYWTANLNISDVEASIRRFAETGAKISITELDIPFGSYSNQHTEPLTLEEEILQAKLYAQLFNVYKKYADHIERVTFWGKADSQSWRAQGSPLLFNRAFAAKQAYYAAIDPMGYLVSHWDNPFDDVSEDEWFHNDVAYVSINSLMVGTSRNTFSPASNVTWSQFLVMLYRLDGQSGSTTGTNWNMASDKWAVENGLAEEGFDSDRMLNKQDMAVIFSKYLKYSGKTLPAEVKQHTYADDDKIDDEAKPAVELLYDAGIMTGKPGNIFDPAGFTNRAEISAIFHRFMESMKNKATCACCEE